MILFLVIATLVPNGCNAAIPELDLSIDSPCKIPDQYYGILAYLGPHWIVCGYFVLHSLP